MSWMNILGALTEALGQPERKSSTLSAGRVRRLEPGETPARDDVARAEAETKRMLEEAQREMLQEFAHKELGPYAERVGRTEERIIDIETNVVSRIDEMKRTIDAVETNTLSIERMEKKVNFLLILALLAVAASVATLVRSFL